MNHQDEQSNNDFGTRVERSISRFFSKLFDQGPSQNHYKSPQPLIGFMGIRFGTDEDMIVDALWEKGWIDISDMTNPDMRIFSGLQFAGQNTEFISIHFLEKKFYKATIFFEKTGLPNTVVPLFEDIKNDLNGKYYKTIEDYRDFDSPSLALLGAEDIAISSGKADYKCFWRFTSDNQTDDFIWIRITQDLRVILSYEHGESSEIASERAKVAENARKNNDY